MEVAEGVGVAAGVGETRADVEGIGRLGGIIVVGDGFGDAAGLDDGEFPGELALEDFDAAFDLGREGAEFGHVHGGYLVTWVDGQNRDFGD